MILNPIADELKRCGSDGTSAYSNLVVIVGLGTDLLIHAPDLEYQRIKDQRRNGLLVAQLWVIESMRRGRDHLLLRSPLHFAPIVNERLTRFIETTYRCVALMRTVPLERLIDGKGQLRDGPWTQVATDLNWQIMDVYSLALLMESTEPPANQHAVALTRDHRAVLSALMQRMPNCLQVHQVVTHCGIHSRETVGKILRELESMRLVHRPFGKRKGYVPTPDGAKVIGFKSAT